MLKKILRVTALHAILTMSLTVSFAARAQEFEKKTHNYNDWTKPFFAEVVTVTGPAKFIFAAGIGAEDEANGSIKFPGDVYAQCKYAYEKIKKALAANGATLSDIVKQVTYVTDMRYRQDVGKCRNEAFAGIPVPNNTFLGVSSLAFPNMLVEIDITAAVSSR
jgi:enamine deaminase RidA (YjgF/YER057c/UK114 family)